jgi:LDH2 family malate/lactate/ureidoglycolate dehydrogenase
VLAPRAAAFAERVRGSVRAPGVATVYAPGDLERERRAQNQAALRLSTELLSQFDALADQLSAPRLARS